MHSDLELPRLERALHQPRDRLGWITRLNSDPAVLRAAEDLCVEATAARDAYMAIMKRGRRIERSASRGLHPIELR
jgi:hypothetical protein